MSRIALTIAGAIAGIATGGLLMGPIFFSSFTSMAGAAMMGASVGGTIGRLVDPMQFQGPRLADLSISSSTNGTPIPFGYGIYRLGGNIIWSPGLVEHQTEESLKGGPSQTTYSYTASFAAAFGEGPAIIKKVWGDTKIIFGGETGIEPAVWDAGVQYYIGDTVEFLGKYYRAFADNLGETPGLPGSFSWFEFVWVSGSKNYPLPTIYPGNQSQLPDATIQADQGAANVPAFRGLAYAVWEDFPLADFGNRIPNLRAEVEFLLPDGSSLTGVADMVNDLCQRAGVDANQIELSKLIINL